MLNCEDGRLTGHVGILRQKREVKTPSKDVCDKVTSLFLYFSSNLTSLDVSTDDSTVRDASASLLISQQTRHVKLFRH